MEKQELVNELKKFLRGLFTSSDLKVCEHRAMKTHLEDFMDVKKPVIEDERFIELIDTDGYKHLVKVSAIVSIITREKQGLTFINIAGCIDNLCCKFINNEEAIENLIADLKG
ncbi:MAG: hypothetical protein H7339_18935 [Arcicella sp.]|nr:hypothetical protein [Arcicella sp.]